MEKGSVPLSTSAPLSRREFGALAGGVLAATAGAACGIASQSAPVSQDALGGRLATRPSGRTPSGAGRTGALGLAVDRDGVLDLPDPLPAAPLPLLVLLHGAGGTGANMFSRIAGAARAANLAVLAPDSRGPSWDAIRGGFGRDVEFLDRALARVFDTVAIDPRRIAIGGFSDGATYALSLGLINGDLFQRIVAFSPGFVVGGADMRGKPHVFVSHGLTDTILPIDRCSHRIVPALRDRGYDVTFREFDGGHEIPRPIATEGMTLVATAR